MNVYHAFDWIEGPILPTWTDWSAPGLKPVVMINRNDNPFDTNYPSVIRGDAYEYYRNSFSPVAAFDKDLDAASCLGATPAIYRAGNSLTRTLVAYNDDFSGGGSLTVDWAAAYQDPWDTETTFANGSFNLRVYYGEKGSRAINFLVPSAVSSNKLLNLRLTVTKNSTQRFQETNRLGYINGMPAAKLYVVWNEYRLDSSFTWDTGCGRKAANAFCSEERFSKSFYYVFDAEPSSADTLTIGTNEICDANEYDCYGFQMIICK